VIFQEDEMNAGRGHMKTKDSELYRKFEIFLVSSYSTTKTEDLWRRLEESGAVFFEKRESQSFKPHRPPEGQFSAGGHWAFYTWWGDYFYISKDDAIKILTLGLP
jgi:hypothetical protein